MAKSTREMFEQLKAGGDQQVGAVQAAVEGVQAIVPGLSLDKILSDIGKELKDQVQHGAHEMASVLFTGNTYIQYARDPEPNTPDHGLSEMQQGQEQDRGGREL